MADSTINNSTDNGIKAKTVSTIKTVKQSPDAYIWGIFITLCIISLVETYSASSREVSKAGIYAPIIKHAIFLAMGAGIVYFLQMIPYQKFLKCIPPFGFLTIILLGYTEMFGDTINGAKRAISFFGFTLQPAEMAKLGVILLIAWIMGKNQMHHGVKNKGIFLSALCVTLFGAFLFKQGLTNTILLMAISMSMMLICGVEWKKFGMVLLIYGVFAGAFLVFQYSSKDKTDSSIATTTMTGLKEDKKNVVARDATWWARISRFMDKKPLYEQPLNSINQQEIFSRMAQANGGVIGVFPGNSRECSRLPLAFSDYIYSIIIEDTGLIGGIIVLVLYLWLFARAGSIASKCNRAVPALLVMGMAVMIVFQALFHMAINTGVFPVSGQPLPLISKGGTSILITSIAFGIMLSVSRTAAKGNKNKEVKDEISSLPESMQGANQGQI